MADTERPHRCGNPQCPRLVEETIAALRAELASVTRERDALRAALGDVFTTESAVNGWMPGDVTALGDLFTRREMAREHALDVLARTGGVE